MRVLGAQKDSNDILVPQPLVFRYLCAQGNMSCKLEGPGCDFYACDSLENLRFGGCNRRILEDSGGLSQVG